jgi:2'-5' RNA ligase
MPLQTNAYGSEHKEYEMKETVYNVFLRPDSDFSEKLISFSNEMSEKNPSMYVLSKESTPHASVLQFSSDLSQQEIIDTFIKYNNNEIYKVSTTGFHLIPSRIPGRIWTELTIQRTGVLEDLQEEVIKRIFLQGTKIYNGTEKNYGPHFTISFHEIDPQKKLSLPDLPISLFKTVDIPCRLHLGLSGEHFQVSEILV